MLFPAPIKPTSNRSQLLLRELPEAHTSITTHDQNRSKQTSFSSNHKMKHSTKSTTWDPTEAVMRKKKIQTEVHIIQPQHVQSQSLPSLRLGKEKKYSASTLRIMSISSSLLNESLLKPYMLPRVCNNHNENVILYYRGIEYCNNG